MSITVNYGDFSGTGADGLASYLAWFEAQYSDEGHATSSGFSTADGNSVQVGGTTSAGFVNDYQYAGTADDENGTPTAAFIAHAGDVANVENSSGTYTLDKLAYTLFSNPAHTLLGNIANLEFGDSYSTSGGLNTMNTTHLNITGIGETVGYGLLDSDNNGTYDTVDDYTDGSNEIHNIIYGLMGGQGGYAQADALENVFDTYGITIEGTAGDDTFDGYAAADTFVLGGGEDVAVNFDVSEDVIDLSGLSGFSDAEEAFGAITYDANGDASLLYGSGKRITLSGVDEFSDLSEANFIV